MVEVRLEGVGKSYDGVTDAIPDLNLLCPRGEMLALLGPSGCGKSSTLKMIAGIEPVSRGAIYFEGIDVSRRDTAERNVAMVFEDYALYPHLSVYENIAFPLRIRSMLRSEVSAQVDRVLDLLDLHGLRDASVRKLSGGAQQRVSIGRALVREPSLVMFDEPLSHLDADQKVQLRTEIKRLQTTSRLTSVLVTHDQNEAISMADRIAVMDKGVLQQVDTPAKVYDEPANLFVAGFIGEPPMNVLSARVLREQDDLFVVFHGRLRLPVPASLRVALAAYLEGPPIVVGVRPEHVSLGQQGAEAPVLGARLARREPCGDRDVLVADTPLGKVVAEVPGPTDLMPGEQLWLRLDPAHLHFFNAQTSANVLAETA
ncbi:Putrescine transport ATP-binding protein PotA (TC 3.A.1.11.1) [plant metagenome]|uniref:Putrescine transport ATP-binding protein PotA (TC 3.A.1.11.1) n=1 Tax=plant metagenome TaxID=1297885 RepID=A0A484PSE3_9ZZZZ